LPDPKQKKLPFLPSGQKKCLGIIYGSPEQKLALPGTGTNDRNMINQEVDQNGSHDKSVMHEQENLASHSIPAHKNMDVDGVFWYT
jgi:hypothetical protein